ncbi:MAG TPA: GAF domain-containing protein, partial [Candidatus Limnocylindrales bacterium]
MLSVAEAVAREVASVIDWHGLRFFVVGRDEQTLEAIVLRSTVPHYANEKPERLRIQIGKGLAGHVAASRVAEIVSDVQHDPRGAKIPGTDDVDESMIVVPLVYEDVVLGVLELIRLGRGAFDATDLRLAQIVGAQAAVALSNARQLEELERRGAALERRLASQRQLLAITERLLLTRDRGQIFDAIADRLAEVVPYDTLTIYLVDRANNCLIPILARDPYADQILATRPALGAGITGDVINKGEAECINDAAHDPRVVHVPGTPADEDESLIVAPVRSPDGVIGSLNLYRVDRRFDDEDLDLVRLFANHVAIALENAAIHERLINAALTDPLTGLPNRRLFADRVEHALARRERVSGRMAVLFLDLDRFKLVNDGLGHAAGDAVLQAVGERLRAGLRTGDTVARLGGDEFGILLEDVAGPNEAGITAQRVLVALSEPLDIDGRTVSVR